MASPVQGVEDVNHLFGGRFDPAIADMAFQTEPDHGPVLRLGGIGEAGLVGQVEAMRGR